MKKEVFDASIIRDIKNDAGIMKTKLVFSKEMKERVMGYCDNMIDNILVMINRLIDVEFYESYNELNNHMLKNTVRTTIKKVLYASLSTKIKDCVEIINQQNRIIIAKILNIPEEIKDHSIYEIRQQKNIVPRCEDDKYDKKINNIISALKTLSERITDAIN